MFLNGGATVTSDGVLQVTDGLEWEARSAYYAKTVQVGSFTTDFTFQLVDPDADGLTFTIQNQCPRSLGIEGGSLGYESILYSVAIKFDLYDNDGEGPDSTGLYINGATPTVPAVDLSTSGIDLHSGDVMDAHMVYDGTNLTMTLTDTVTNASVVEVFPVDIPAVLGSNTGYVGFTGGTGGYTATQNVLTWSYVSPGGGLPAVATPTLSPSATTYTSPQSVTISDATAGATIYYTTDGTTPTTSSNVYSGPITVSTTEMLQAIAVEAGYRNSLAATGGYTISSGSTGGTTYINLGSGDFTASSFFLNGGATITSDGVLQITDDLGYEARSAWFATPVPVGSFTTDFTFQFLDPGADGITFTIQTEGPSALGEFGGYLGYAELLDSVAVKFDLYNNDGEGPDSTGLYTNGTSPVDHAIDLSATGIDLHSGDIMAAHMVYDGTNLTMTLTDTVTSGSAVEIFPIDIPATVGANTAYVGFTGGTGEYTATQNVLTWSYAGSTTASAAATPTFSPAAGTYTTSQSVTISDATAGATLYYTTDGTTPTTSSSVYSGPITVSTNEMIEAIAVETGYSNSSAATAAYVIAPVLPTPSFSPAAGTYTTSQSVTISDATAGTTLYYTTDGTTPTTSSSVYSGPITVSTNETIEAIAVETGYTNSTTASAAYTINCTSSGYSYVRSIVIDNAKVPHTDQTNFPFLFNTTDPLLKSTVNGGHVTSSTGDDIIFSTDPNGLTKLDHELEEYNPVTGQVIAWVRIPTLSHSTNTSLYVFYGNSSITAPQQNPTGVWDSNYKGVWHLATVNGSLNVNDSTGTNTMTNHGATASGSGPIGEAAAFSSAGSQYIDAGNSASLQLTTLTMEMWVETSDINSLQVLGGDVQGANGYGLVYHGDYNNYFQNFYFDIQKGGVENSAGVPSNNGSNPITSSAWYHIAGTYDGSTIEFYSNGMLVATTSASNALGIASGDFSIGRCPDGSCYVNGSISESRVSNVARSADWIATEYNNQSSPSTFYALSPEYTIAVSPAAVRLYSSQNQQFAAAVVGSAGCSSAVSWSMPPSAPGTLTAGGIYTAPASITTMQSVTITATSQTDTSIAGSAIVTLAPPPPALMLTAAAQPPYATGSSQGFVATVTDQYGVSVSGATVNFTVVGVNDNSGSAITDANGIATYTYVGANSGNDTLQASATIVNGQLATSNSITVAWTAPVPANSEGSVSLVAVPSVGLEGLLGAFTDSSGAVIEPLIIGASPRVFVVPAGATQLQLGVSDSYYADNWGDGFVVDVNDVPVTVPAGAMPWLWVVGGLNSDYEWGVQDGTPPIVAATNLIAGQTVVVAYKSGLNSPGGLYSPIYDANGVPTLPQPPVPGEAEFYMSAAAYPLGQPVSVAAVVTNGSGTAMPNVPVLLDVAGPNTRQLLAVTNSNGQATFTYSGLAAGTDALVAEATPSGETTLFSTQTSVTWVAPLNLPAGSLVLSPSSVQPLPIGGQQSFTVYATDSFGSPVAGLYVDLIITGADQMRVSGTTDATGHVTLVYHDVNPGTASVDAVAYINDLVAISNAVSVPWTLPPSTTGNNGGSGTLTISISSENTVTLPNTLQLNGSVADSALSSGGTIATTWSQVSGPGTITFANSQQTVTTASFSQVGIYVLQLAASDADASGSVQLTVTVNPVPGITQGWIGSPVDGSPVSGIVPITVAPGVTLQSGTLTYFPADNQFNVITLNPNTTGSGQIGTFDTTTLQDGSYWIGLQATDTTGNSQYSLTLVTVVGNNKPGRVTATVTDLVVPANGLSINIQRIYDSLNAGTSSDFGYGWSLGTNVDLVVGPRGSVTFTLNGQRRMFYLTPQLGSALLPYDYVAYTPEPGFYGTLTESAPGCPSLFDFVVPYGAMWACVDGGLYNPPGFVYTDPTGTSYTISANGGLQSIIDKNGNALTITSSGITSSTGLSVPFTRDSSGRIIQITDPLGNYYGYSYDPTTGDLTNVTYTPATPPSTPQSSTYTYTNHLYTGGTDFNGNQLPTTNYYQSTVDSSGNCQGDCDINGLPLNGRLKSVTASPNTNTTYTTGYAYNLATNTTTITYPPDANGNTGTATMVYDSYGMLLSSTAPFGPSAPAVLTTTNTYDANHNLISVTDPLGQVNSYTYDSLGNRTSVTSSVTSTLTVTSSTTYNQLSEPTSTTDELGNVRTFNYDASFNPLSVTDTINGLPPNPPATLSSFIFNANGTMQAGAIGYDIVADPSKASHFTYDGNGNLICRVDALGNATSYSYDSLGHKVSMTEPQPGVGCLVPLASNAATTKYVYDAFGNLTETDAPLNRTTKSAYDNNGNKTSDTDALGHTTYYKYDALNRLIETDYLDQTKSTKTYDFRGNVIDEWDQAGIQTHRVYYLDGRLESTTLAYGTTIAATTTVGYDADGNPTSIEDADDHTTGTAFDLRGEVTGKTLPGPPPLPGGSQTESRTYDAAGNLSTITHFNGVVTTYGYDARNRLISRATPGEATVGFTYTATGNRATMTDASGTTTYNYDNANRLTSKATPEGTLTYTYDTVGNLASMTSSNTNGASVSYTYDLLNRLSTVVDNRLAGNRTTTYTYDTANNVVTVAYPNGLTSTLSYDALNRLTELSTPPAADFNYTLGLTGNRTGATEHSGRTLTWSYDGIYRLTQEQIIGDPAGNNGIVNYTGLDSVGNRTSDTSTIPSISALTSSYNLNDEMSTETYDNNGNTLTTGSKTFTYDSENHLMNGGAVSLVYDGDGNRVAKTANGITTQYLVDDLSPTGYAQVVDELTGGAVSRTYTYGLQHINEDQVISNAWTPSFYGYDGGGNVRQLTNLAGAVTDTYDYDAFGNLLNPAGATTPNNYRYRGEQYDADLGLYYLRARYYNPATGRFMSRDPEDGNEFEPKTLHKYLYAGGDPVNGLDPRGREDLVEYAAFTAHNAFEGTIYGKHVGKCATNAFNQAADLLSAIFSGTPTGLTGEGIGSALEHGANAAAYDLAAGFITGQIVPYSGQDCE